MLGIGRLHPERHVELHELGAGLVERNQVAEVGGQGDSVGVSGRGVAGVEEVLRGPLPVVAGVEEELEQAVLRADVVEETGLGDADAVGDLLQG